MRTQQQAQPQQFVFIGDIAGELGWSIEGVASALEEVGIAPAPDWRGRLMVPEEAAKAFLEKTRAEDAEKRRREIALEAASRAYNAQTRQVYEEALATERAKQHREQIEDMKKVERHHNIASYTINGAPPTIGSMASLGPEYEQRAQAAATAVRDKWISKNPMPDVD